LKEFEFIESLKHLSKGDSLSGIGDDAALTDNILIAKDIVIEGIHFTSGAPLKNVIFRLFTANISDIAAMGGRADRVLLGFALPHYIDKKELAEAVEYACKFYNVDLIGGDTTSSKSCFFASLTVLGKPSKYILRRNGAKVGDVVYISRPIGGVASMLARELAGEKNYDHYMNTAEVELGELLGGFGVNSCLDISDGLGRDASHIAKASGVRIDFDSKLFPVYEAFKAVSSGEEYALCFTIDESRASKLEEQVLLNLSRKIYKIGAVREGSDIYLDEILVSNMGWEHY
jgi:thiamine-monophosphate kinase